MMSNGGHLIGTIDLPGGPLASQVHQKQQLQQAAAPGVFHDLSAVTAADCHVQVIKLAGSWEGILL
jgi:hypothetical protein